VTDPSQHSFVVCAYGESPYLEDCVRSLRDQTVTTQVLMATSTPNRHIERVAARYDVPLVASGQKPGIASDWNHAIGCARTPLVTLAHQDDRYLPRYAEQVLTYAERAQHPLIFFTDYAELRGDEVVVGNAILQVKRLLLAPMRHRPINDRRGDKRAILRWGSAVCCPSVTYCTDNLPQPPFSQGLSCDLDWDAWERFSRLEGEFVYIDEILMQHRIHEASETSRLIHDNTRTQEDFEMLCRFWPTPLAKLINLAYAGSQKSNG
jgi:glycosyltransferase involved in cell wall biosynthesis